MGQKKYNEKSIKFVSITETFIINIPVWLFLMFAFLCLILGGIIQGILRTIAFLAAWWSLSGAVMLLIDYKRKFRTYLYLICKKSISPPTLTKLQDTICGYCVYLSLLYRKKFLKQRNSFLPGKSNDFI